MFTFTVMFAAVAALPSYNLPPRRVSLAVKCTDDCRIHRYRLPSSDEGGPSVKSRALEEDGGECNVVGAKLCTTTPRRILTSAY